MDENTNWQDIQQEENELYFDVNIPEQIFQAIDIIIKKRLEQLPYDQTIEGQVVSNERAFFGEYMIKAKSGLIFKAYSENTKYKLYERVYITVPQGDYSKQKIISGKIIPENTEYLIGTPTTYEELLGGDYTGADWDVVPTNNQVNIGTSEEKKKDLLNQFLEVAKQYTDHAIALRNAQNQAYLNGLEKYFNDSDGLIVDEDTGKVRFKDQASQIATATVQHQKNLDTILQTYQQEINSFAQIIRSFITPNREIKE